MKDAILIELAIRWERDAKVPEDEVISVDTEIARTIESCAHTARETKQECADTLRTLIKMLGD